MGDHIEKKKRHRSEIDYHDKKAEKSLNSDDMYYQGATQDSYTKLLKIAGDLKGKRVLDFGCGTGWSSINLAKKGALVFGVDISHNSLKIGNDLIIKKSLQDEVFFVQSSVETLPFKKDFDIIIGISILHHLDLNDAINSLNSSLKSKGKALFMEPLGHNPLINLFRLMTPERRTQDEKPINMEFIT